MAAWIHPEEGIVSMAGSGPVPYLQRNVEGWLFPGARKAAVSGRGSSVLEEELLSLQTAQGCPAVRLLKLQVSLAALTKSSSNTLSILCFCFLAPIRAGCTEPLNSQGLLSCEAADPSGVVTVPCTKGGRVLCESFSQEDKFSLELPRKAPTPLSQSQACPRGHRG